MRVAVIGGGASGMVAAIAAARSGASVAVFERGERVGRKLLATGNGRCNLTNLDLAPGHFHGRQPAFPLTVLRAFDARRALEFFDALGIAGKVEDRGRVFPRSGQASSVLDALRWEMEDLGVQVHCGSAVREVRRMPPGFGIVAGEGGAFPADRVVLATGGRAAPNLGADGSGYALARALGHTVIEPFPALAPLRLSSPWLRTLQGVRFEGAVEAWANGRRLAGSRGEVLFTDHGASGPAVLDVCRGATEALLGGEPVELRITVVEELDLDALAVEIGRRLDALPRRTVPAALVGFLNKRLLPPVLREAGLPDLDRPAGNVSGDERRRIASLLKDWRFPVIGPGPWASAQVTAGGVDVSEVDPATLESRRVRGLYLAGELLDVDGDCGGFNLHWAWASGHVAGGSAARRVA